MKVRGHRECQECGTHWTYYETESVECPSCGSLRSLGVDEERRLHTATAATLDLTEVRSLVDTQPLREVAKQTVETVREFTRGYGFISGGQLQSLDDTYLTAIELRTIADTVGRATNVTDDEKSYFFSLLSGAAEGDRPRPERVPDSMTDSRGLAYAKAVEEYRKDLRTYLDEQPDETASELLGRLRGHVKRALALDGAIPAREAETLIEAARAIGAYVADGDETALVTAESRFDSLD
ncbi:MAG: TFIIB-type zinc ribbon-containing protein [Halobacteriales archaeon]|nr:TFIIB-type zinc ribbon-containing protein [Halobacteriales archaeon]